MKPVVCHCEEPAGRRSNLDPVVAIGTRLLCFARNDLLRLLIISGLVIGAMAAPAHAVRPDEMLPDPALEARARDIGQELRCLVCRNQSIDDSDADLAHDLRVLVRERLKAGDTNDQVIAYIRSRYGDFVLLRPPFEAGTVLLWVGPALILLLGACGVARFYRARGRDRSVAANGAALSPDEQRRLDAVLGEER
jgi:cytochrome c-type biogenesis protein CcmH